MKTLNFISALLHISKTAEPIENKSDYTRVKRWVNKATSLYIIFTVIALVISIVFFNSSSPEVPLIVIIFVAIFVGLGGATLLMNFKLMLKSTWSAGADGYKIGKTIQTNHINVTHEYGDRYKVSTYTENQGCAVAYINGLINLFVWCFLCVYICPFLSFKKISDSKKNLRIFEATQM